MFVFVVVVNIFADSTYMQGWKKPGGFRKKPKSTGVFGFGLKYFSSNIAINNFYNEKSQIKRKYQKFQVGVFMFGFLGWFFLVPTPAYMTILVNTSS